MYRNSHDSDVAETGAEYLVGCLRANGDRLMIGYKELLVARGRKHSRSRRCILSGSKILGY